MGGALGALAYRLALSGATAELARRFRAERVSWVLLKGPSLAEWLYPMGGRDYGDIDILVSESELPKARAILTSLGYREIRHFRTKRRRGLATVLVRDHDKARIDLQTTIRGAGASPNRQWQTLSQDLGSIRVAGEDVSVLSRPAMAAFVATHAAQHAGHSKMVEDLKRALKVVSIDGWRDALAITQELDALAYFAQGLRLVPEGRALAERLGVPDVATTELLLRFGPHRRTRTIEVFLNSSWQDRWRLIVELVIPSRHFMLQTYSMARLGRVGLVATYLARPFFLVFQAFEVLPGWVRARRQARSRAR